PAGTGPGTPAATQAPSYAKTGPGTFTTAAGGTGKVGHGGQLIRYKVQVEKKIGVDAATFARQVDTVLAAPRGWTKAGKWSFQHVTCQGKGKPAPVMMQQMFGLKGCVTNVWPYTSSGRLITGPPVKGQ